MTLTPRISNNTLHARPEAKRKDLQDFLDSNEQEEVEGDGTKKDDTEDSSEDGSDEEDAEEHVQEGSDEKESDESSEENDEEEGQEVVKRYRRPLLGNGTRGYVT